MFHAKLMTMVLINITTLVSLYHNNCSSYLSFFPAHVAYLFWNFHYNTINIIGLFCIFYRYLTVKNEMLGVFAPRHYAPALYTVISITNCII